MQVVGFKKEDTHYDVLVKGAKGLSLHDDVDSLSLLCSGGLVPDSPITGNIPWTLGDYIKHHGGNQNRGKGIWVMEEEEQRIL